MKILTNSEVKCIAGGDMPCDPSFSLAPGDTCSSYLPAPEYFFEVEVSPLYNFDYLSVRCKGALQTKGLGPNSNVFVCFLDEYLFLYNAVAANSTVKGTVLMRKAS